MPLLRHPILPSSRAGLFASAMLAWNLLAANLSAQTSATPDPLLQPLPEFVRPAPSEKQPASEELFEQILVTAATNSPVMRQQEDIVSQADASRFRSWLRHMPTLAASYSAGVYYQTSVTGSSSSTLTPGGSLTLEARQPIYHWGAFDAQTDLGILREQIAQNDAILAYAQVCLDLRKRYLGLIVQKTQSATLAAEVVTAKKHLDQANLMLAQGRITSAEVNRLEIEWNELQVRRDAASANFKSQLAEFRRLSGSRSFEAQDVPDAVFLPVLDQSNLQAQYEQYKKDGYTQSLAARSADLNEKALDQQIIMNNANRKPMFDLAASVSQAPYINGNNNGLKFGTIFFVGVTGTWNIFDRGDSFAVTQSLYAQKRQAENRYADSRQQAFDDAAASLDRIDLDLRALGVLKSQYQQQQDEYKRRQIFLSAGHVTSTAVDAARDALLDTRGQILARQADAADAYYSYLSDIFRDPALANAPSFTHPR